jgi:hypothetical protein
MLTINMVRYKNKKKLNIAVQLFVGVAGFEPATSWSQTRRDDRATLHPECGISIRGCKYTI